MRKLFFILLGMCAFQFSYAQEEVQDEWKPETNITGYVNTLFEYTDLDNGFEDPKKATAGLGEAAFLISYKPLRNLELKGTFVYSHFMKDFQQYVVEAFGTYTLHPAFKISGGKFLTPLSPVNQYFYAPLNVAATLPMVVSHHTLLPQSITGFMLSGEYGNDFKIGYNATYGLRGTLGAPSSGLLGLQGRESYASYAWTDQLATQKMEYKQTATGRIYANFKDLINLGVNYMDAKDARFPYQVIGATGVTTSFTPSSYYSFGVDLQLKLGGLKVNAEYWTSESKTTELTNQIVTSMGGYYAEASYEFGKFSPYVRYDFADDSYGSVFLAFPDTKLFDARFTTTAYTAGLSFRPFYELMLKAEYRYLDNNVTYEDVNIPAPLQTALPPDNPLKVTADKFNHFVLSLVYSF